VLVEGEFRGEDWRNLGIPGHLFAGRDLHVEANLTRVEAGEYYITMALMLEASDFAYVHDLSAGYVCLPCELLLRARML
jgi:hypothetical protein